MVMALFRGLRRPDHQYSVVIVREAKCTRLRCMTRLSSLHTLDPPFGISISMEQSFDNIEPRARK
jgi:hypothetical protein